MKNFFSPNSMKNWYVLDENKLNKPFTKSTAPPKPIYPKDEKKASVLGRAVAGGIIAGPLGAAAGALSAIDKNICNAIKKSDK